MKEERKKWKKRRAGVHLFDCESLHRNKGSKKKESRKIAKEGEKHRKKELKKKENQRKREQRNKKREERIEDGRETAKEKPERRLCSICFSTNKNCKNGKRKLGISRESDGGAE
jgi:hypothetical protein